MEVLPSISADGSPSFVGYMKLKIMRARMILFFLVCTGTLTAQTGKRITPEEYVMKFKDAAVADMARTGVPASITLAQGMYESDYGNSPLAKNANNHFGIKCHDWKGDTYHQDDDTKDECFRKYNSVLDSYDDHSLFLKNRQRYSSLFQLEITDYKGWAHGLKKAGYATNPMYAHKLIDIIERYQLHEFDRGGTVAAFKPEPKTETRAEPVASITRAISDDFKEVKKEKTVSEKTQNINGLPVIIAEKGDSWLKLSREHNLELWQILKYNDSEKNDILKENQRVFLKQKKNRTDIVFHQAKTGESMKDISNLYGVKLNKLYKRNHMKYGEQPVAGQKIYLKANKSFYE